MRCGETLSVLRLGRCKLPRREPLAATLRQGNQAMLACKCADALLGDVKQIHDVTGVEQRPKPLTPRLFGYGEASSAASRPWVRQGVAKKRPKLVSENLPHRPEGISRLLRDTNGDRVDLGPDRVEILGYRPNF